MQGIFVKKRDVFYFACMALLKITQFNLGDEYGLSWQKRRPVNLNNTLFKVSLTSWLTEKMVKRRRRCEA